MTKPPRKFPPPWTVEPTPSGYRITDSNGIAIAYLYGEDRIRPLVKDTSLTGIEAQTLARWIARLPELARAADRAATASSRSHLREIGAATIEPPEKSGGRG